MSLASFFSFRSRATKYGSIVGATVFAAGAGGSAALALKLSSLCSSAVSSFIESIGTQLSIPELSGDVVVDGYTANFTIQNVTIAIPKSLLDLINSTEELPAYCYSVPFTLGLCITTAISLALASAITSAIHIHNHDNEQVRNNDNLTTPLTMVH